MTITELRAYCEREDRLGGRASPELLAWLETLTADAPAEEAWEECARGERSTWLCARAGVPVPPMLVRRWVLRAAREHLPAHLDAAVAAGCDARLSDYAAALRSLPDNASWMGIWAAAAAARAAATRACRTAVAVAWAAAWEAAWAAAEVAGATRAAEMAGAGEEVAAWVAEAAIDPDVESARQAAELCTTVPWSTVEAAITRQELTVDRAGPQE